MTSGNESEVPSVTGSTPQNGENKPPQAIVKPQVLTHVIEGFVIQEGAEPFPVCVSGEKLLAARHNKQPRAGTLSVVRANRELSARKYMVYTHARFHSFINYQVFVAATGCRWMNVWEDSRCNVITPAHKLLGSLPPTGHVLYLHISFPVLWLNKHIESMRNQYSTFN